MRDFYICGANKVDWDAALNRLRSNWMVAGCFTVDGEIQELPSSFEEILHLRKTASPLLKIKLAGASINCHFLGDEEIEFDFRPEDIRTPESWSAICEFFQDMINTVDKPGIVTYENRSGDVFVKFNPNEKIG